MIYSPPQGFTNADSFPFIISDGRGGQSPGTASVIVKADDTTPQNLSIEYLGVGSVRLVFDGIADRTYSVQFTEDLNSPNWQTLGSVTSDEHGVFTYVDAPRTGSAQRFYRAAWP